MIGRIPVPLVGAMPGGGQKIYMAMGFAKAGMTHAAALTLSATLLGGTMPWAARQVRRELDRFVLADAAQTNAEVGVLMGAGQIGAQLRSATGTVPPEGQGVVGRGRGVKPTAVSTVGGTTCAVSALCSHLGGVVTRNDAEKSWDCPLHGSRFAPDGTVLEGLPPHRWPLADHGRDRSSGDDAAGP